MPLKVDLFMALNGQTYSESHYYLLGNTLPVLPGPFTYLAALRAACLGYGAALTGIRISTVPASGTTQDLYFGISQYVPVWPLDPIGGTYQATIPNDAVLIRMTSGLFGAFPEKSLYLASPPSVAISTLTRDPADLGSNAAFNTALGQYMYLLTGAITPNSTSTATQGQWGYRVRDRSTPFQAGVPVTNAGYPGMIGIPTFNQLPNVGFLPGNTHEIYITGYRRINPRLQGLSGVWRVGAILPPVAPAVFPWTYFLLNSGNVSPTNFSTIGQAAPLAYLYEPYGPFWSVDKAVTRKRGESIGARRGRSKIRA